MTGTEVQGGANGSALLSGDEGLRRGSAGDLSSSEGGEQTGLTGTHETGIKSMNSPLGRRGRGGELSLGSDKTGRGGGSGRQGNTISSNFVLEDMTGNFEPITSSMWKRNRPDALALSVHQCFFLSWC